MGTARQFPNMLNSPVVKGPKKPHDLKDSKPVNVYKSILDLKNTKKKPA